MQRKPIRCTQCKVCAEKIHQSGWWCTALQWNGRLLVHHLLVELKLIIICYLCIGEPLKSRVVQIIKLIKSARPRALMRSSNNCLLLVKSKISKVQLCAVEANTSFLSILIASYISYQLLFRFFLKERALNCGFFIRSLSAVDLLEAFQNENKISQVKALE